MLAEQGFEQTASLRDEHGIHSTVFTHENDDRKYVVVSKEYSFRGVASFMEKVVRAAVQYGNPLIFYNDEDESFTVFDAPTVLEFGVSDRGPSKRADEDWLNIGIEEYGIPLDRFLDGEEPTLPGGQRLLGSYQ